jgi:lysozyme family protein
MKNGNKYIVGAILLALTSLATWRFTKDDLARYDKLNFAIDSIPCVNAFVTKIIGYEGTLKDWNAIPANIHDRGGRTNRGVTETTYMSLAPIILQDAHPTPQKFEALSYPDARKFVLYFYHRIFGDLFQSKAIAFEVTDMSWASGEGLAIARLQIAVNQLRFMTLGIAFDAKNKPSDTLKVDGIIGKYTINAANDCDPSWLNNRLMLIRKEAIERDVALHKNQHVFYFGWMRKVAEIGAFCARIIQTNCNTFFS